MRSNIVSKYDRLLSMMLIPLMLFYLTGNAKAGLFGSPKIKVVHTMPPEVKLGDINRIAILPIKYDERDRVYSKMSSKIHEAGQGITLIERSELASILAEQNLAASDLVDIDSVPDLGAIQGVDALIEAAPRVIDQVPDVHFLIMGYPHEEHYRRIVSQRGLERHMTFPGRIPYDEAARWLNLGTVAVSAKTSLTESNGKLVNYMACGLPVVSTDTPINRELLGEAGIYAAVDDPAALAACLSKLLLAPAHAKEVGALLRRRAEQKFSWPRLTERLLQVYEHLIAGATVSSA